MRFQIESRDGVVFGIYEGETAEDAFAAMVEDAGDGLDVDGNPTAGAPEDWIIKPVTGEAPEA